MKKKYFIPVACIFAIFMVYCKNTGASEKQDKDPKVDDQRTSASIAESDFVKTIDKSPRHQEWISLNSNGRELYTFVVYPEKSEKAKTIIMIHENRGLNDWARYFADQLAAEGFIVLAPDLLSNFEKGIEKTTDFSNADQARDAIYKLKPNAVTNDLDAVFAYAKKIDSSTGEIAVAGFCWGGTQTFAYATHNPDISEAHVFYGTAPENAEAIKKIGTPIYGYYGGNDNRVTATVEKTKTIMARFNKKYAPVIYEGAGHAFMRSGSEDSSDAANRKAHDQALKRLLNVLNKD